MTTIYSDLITQYRTNSVDPGLWGNHIQQAIGHVEVPITKMNKETITNITGITKANPAVVTTGSGHGLITGDSVYINFVEGMTEVNGKYYTATVIDATHYSINVNSTNFNDYTDAGTSYSVPNSFCMTEIPVHSYLLNLYFVSTRIEGETAQTTARVSIGFYKSNKTHFSPGAEGVIINDLNIPEQHNDIRLNGAQGLTGHSLDVPIWKMMGFDNPAEVPFQKVWIGMKFETLPITPLDGRIGCIATYVQTQR